MSITKGFDYQLGTRNVKHVEMFRFYLFQVGTVNTVTSTSLTPDTFGARIRAMAQLFTRFRIIKCVFTYYSMSGSNAVGRLLMGVSEDNGTEGGSGPSPANGREVFNLRTATSCSIGECGELEWKPLDRDKLYYNFGVSGSEQRLIIPGTFHSFVDSGTQNAGIELRCTIEFSGESGD